MAKFFKESIQYKGEYGDLKSKILLGKPLNKNFPIQMMGLFSLFDDSSASASFVVVVANQYELVLVRKVADIRTAYKLNYLLSLF